MRPARMLVYYSRLPDKRRRVNHGNEEHGLYAPFLVLVRIFHEIKSMVKIQIGVTMPTIIWYKVRQVREDIA